MRMRERYTHSVKFRVCIFQKSRIGQKWVGSKCFHGMYTAMRNWISLRVVSNEGLGLRKRPCRPLLKGVGVRILTVRNSQVALASRAVDWAWDDPLGTAKGCRLVWSVGVGMIRYTHTITISLQNGGFLKLDNHVSDITFFFLLLLLLERNLVSGDVRPSLSHWC